MIIRDPDIDYGGFLHVDFRDHLAEHGLNGLGAFFRNIQNSNAGHFMVGVSHKSLNKTSSPDFQPFLLK